MFNERPRKGAKRSEKKRKTHFGPNISSKYERVFLLNYKKAKCGMENETTAF